MADRESKHEKRNMYTDDERELLISLVENYRDIVDDRRTNSAAVEQKILTWETIAKEYNASTPNARTPKQLTDCYRNSKRRLALQQQQPAPISDDESEVSSQTFDNNEDRESHKRVTFTVHERDLLLNIVDSYKDIVENKKINNAAIQAKNAAWEVIAREYNDHTPNTRTPKQLLDCFRNMKKRFTVVSTAQNDCTSTGTEIPESSPDDDDEMSNQGNEPEEDQDREDQLQRSRSVFSNYERDLLLNIVDTYKDIVENKKTTTAAIQEKTTTWEAIARQYNELTTNTRTHKQLLDCYRNMKKRFGKPHAVTDQMPDRGPDDTETSIDSKDQASQNSQQRKVVYSNCERDLLLSIVDTYMDVVENKSTTNAVVQQKNSAWEAIADEYNLRTLNTRTAKQLLDCYRNLKKRAAYQLRQSGRDLESIEGILGSNLTCGLDTEVEADTTDKHKLDQLLQKDQASVRGSQTSISSSAIRTIKKPLFMRRDPFRRTMFRQNPIARRSATFVAQANSRQRFFEEQHKAFLKEHDMKLKEHDLKLKELSIKMKIHEAQLRILENVERTAAMDASKLNLQIATPDISLIRDTELDYSNNR